MRAYKTERGGEFAKHGFCRRLDTLVRCIDRVYELLPPAQETIPASHVVADADTKERKLVFKVDRKGTKKSKKEEAQQVA